MPGGNPAHPHGIEFGQLKRMAAASELKLLDFLVESFSRVGKKSAPGRCANDPGLKGTLKVKGLSTGGPKKSSSEPCRKLRCLRHPLRSASPPIARNYSGADSKEGVSDGFCCFPHTVEFGLLRHSSWSSCNRVTGEGCRQRAMPPPPPLPNRVPLMYQQGALCYYRMHHKCELKAI